MMLVSNPKPVLGSPSPATVLLTCLVVVFQNTALAWDNNVVHPGLTREAIELVDHIDEIDTYGDFHIYLDPQCSRIVEGSVKEDLFTSPSDSWDVDLWGQSECEPSTLKMFLHGYNPVTGAGWYELTGINSVDYAYETWLSARQNHGFGLNEAAYFELGRVCHLLGDMSSPPHVHSDGHASLFGIGEGDGVENWGRQYWGTPLFAVDTSDLTPYVPGGIVRLGDGTNVPGESLRGFLHSLSEYTYNLSSFQGELYAFFNPQPDSELKRMFPSLHYDYFWGSWEIDDIGYFEDILDDEWWACQGDYLEDYNGPGGLRRIYGNFYIEYTPVAEPAAFEKPLQHSTFTHGMKLPEIYCMEVWPEAIRYLAGLLTTFPHDADYPATIHVDTTNSTGVENGTIDHPFKRIQSGIDAAFDGDTVSVADGTYTGDGNRDITFRGKAIGVCSKNGPLNCTIDCQGAEEDPHRGFLLSAWPDASGRQTVRGFTITGGYTDWGGGIYSDNSDVIVSNCKLVGNHADVAGGGIMIWSGAVGDCMIADNTAYYYGGGLSGYCGELNISNCTIAHNLAAEAGGGILTDGNCLLKSNILWDNAAPLGPQLSIGYDCGGITALLYTDIRGGETAIDIWFGDLVWGSGNIDMDPRFQGADDYHLRPISRCINAGDPSGDYSARNDIDGEPRVRYGYVDIGADEVFRISGDFAEPVERIDSADLEVIAHSWLDSCDAPSWCGGCDVDQNHVVNFRDFGTFAYYWLNSSTP